MQPKSSFEELIIPILVGGKFLSKKAKEVKENAGNLIKMIDDEVHNKSSGDESDSYTEIRIGFPGFSKKIYCKYSPYSM
jgi:hypothetical protein